MFDWSQDCFCLQNEPKPASPDVANLHIHYLGFLSFKQKSGVCDLLLILMSKIYLPPLPWDFYQKYPIFGRNDRPTINTNQVSLISSFQILTKEIKNKNPQMGEGESRIINQ